MRCTWKECGAEGTKSQLDKNGCEWALLCEAHHEELEAALDSLEPKKLMRAWARAGSGHKSREEFKRDVSKGMQSLGQFAQRLRKAKRGG
jgi:hypothetical protein